jgi:hypothetical protein
VGTVLRFGPVEEAVDGYAALICSRRVVLPALSRPRRRMEYSGGVSREGFREVCWGGRGRI